MIFESYSNISDVHSSHSRIRRCKFRLRKFYTWVWTFFFLYIFT